MRYPHVRCINDPSQLISGLGNTQVRLPDGNHDTNITDTSPADARWRPSEHCDRPRSKDDQALDVFQCDAIVVHCVSLPDGEFGTGARRLQVSLTAQNIQVSATLRACALRRICSSTGGAILCSLSLLIVVPAHAGQSSWRAVQAAIGSVWESSLKARWLLIYDAQYVALTEVCAALCAHYPSLSPSAIVGHQEIAPGRKQDPGPYFHWPHCLCRIVVWSWLRSDCPKFARMVKGVNE